MDDSRLLPPNAIDATNPGLLGKARINDPQAWSQLTYLYGPVVRFWILRSGVSSRSDVSDILQNVFVAVATNLKSFERDEGTGKFRAWLKTITRNKVNDHYRRLGKQFQARGGSTAAIQLDQVAARNPDASNDGSNSVAADVDSEKSLLTQRVLESLKGEFREHSWQAFQRTVVDGRSAAEVASELGSTAAAIRKTKSRILQRLREVLRELDIE